MGFDSSQTSSRFKESFLRDGKTERRRDGFGQRLKWEVKLHVPTFSMQYYSGEREEQRPRVN